jgi:hypothetical protein
MAHVLGLEMSLAADPPMSDDGVTDLIEAIIDALDEHGYPPSVRSTGSGASVRMTVEVVVPSGNLESFEAGVAAIRAALGGAGIEAAGARIEQPSFRVLQAV